MTPRIRLRRHSDGRVAVLGPGDHWCVVDGDATYGAQGEICVSGPGWSELFVAELPEPDGHFDVVNSDGHDVLTPYWNTSPGCQATAWIDGVSIGDPMDGDLAEDLDRLRVESLKILAAVAACERHRAERESSIAPPATAP